MTGIFFNATGEKSNKAVLANNLSKQFLGEYAVQNVSFEIPHGSIFGFIGPSGSGKTTTIRLLTGIYKPTSGDVAVLGRNPRHFTPKQRQKIGYMPQLFALYPDLSILENINFAASLYGMGLLTRGRQLKRSLEFVELFEHRNKLARNISGGMQRRLSLAATLVHNPELLFLDEPTAGVDPVLRAKFWEHFQNLKQQGQTLILTTQYVGEAAYCDYVGVMIDGSLLLVDSPSGLRRQAFGGEVVDLSLQDRIDYDQLQQIQNIDFVRGAVSYTGEKSLRIKVDEAKSAIPELIAWCNEHDIKVVSIQEFMPPFDDVFIQLVKNEEAREVEHND